jgi:magnesium-transporting ATPase (P-type)
MNLLAVTQTAEETNSDDEPPPNSSDWYLLVPNQITPQFDNDAEQAIGQAEAAKRSKPNDANTHTSIPQHATSSLLGAQFKNLIILILMVVAVTPILLCGTIETLLILTIISLNTYLIQPGEIS